MAEPALALRDHPQIIDLISVLEQNGLQKQKEEVQALVGYIDGMEEKLSQMMDEMKEMRMEVGKLHDKGIRLISEMLNENLKKEQTTTVLLETMAGKGTEVGRTFEELQSIMEKVQLSDKLGVCLDTCHVWDAGYDIVNDLDGVLEEFDRVIGLKRLKAIHINDSLNERGSHKDRHARIGEGKIGLPAFERIVRHPHLQGLPFILETPNDEEGWAKEIEMLRRASQDQ